MEGTCNDCIFPLNKKDSQGTCPTDTSLTYAAGRGKLSCVKELIDAGVDVNSTCVCHGNGALLNAATCGNSDCLTDLINAGADVNIRNKNGQTALMFAADTQCLTNLITAGAEMNVKDNDGIHNFDTCFTEGMCRFPENNYLFRS